VFEVKLQIRATAQGVELIPADAESRVQLERVRKDAADAAEKRLRQKRDEYFGPSGKGYPLTRLRKQLDEAEDAQTAAANRVTRLGVERAEAVASGDLDRANALDQRRTAATQERNDLRGQVGKLKHDLDRLDLAHRTTFRAFMEEARAAHKSENESRILAVADALSEVIDVESVVEVTEATAALASDARLDREVALRTKDGSNRHVNLFRHIAHTRPIAASFVDSLPTPPVFVDEPNSWPSRSPGVKNSEHPDLMRRAEAA
jgi:hypothetical protein